MLAGSARLEEALAAASLREGDALVVAVSGGLDSVALLHLLRFGRPLPGVHLHAAHFDHAMRPESRGDALWVAGLCRAWGVPLHAERAVDPPRSEAAARAERYAFLERVRAELGARYVATAHHADDQAETVLFRALRGTGPGGLAGIPAQREPGVWRPLLGCWREELAAYAAGTRITWREDPTNEQLRFARNALRTRVLPEIERLVAPEARRALVRLAGLAQEDEAAWQSLLPMLMEPLELDRESGETSLDRGALLALHPAARARVLRALLADLGLHLDEAATRRALAFAAEAGSGRRLELGASWELHRELDRLVLRTAVTVARDAPLRITDTGPGAGRAVLSGRPIAVVWGAGEEAGVGPARLIERFDPATLRFPLWVRAREPGDRIRLKGGTKKVKKLFLERRIPMAKRDCTPLIVDAEGEVLWIPDVARAEPRPGTPSVGALRIGIG